MPAVHPKWTTELSMEATLVSTCRKNVVLWCHSMPSMYSCRVAANVKTHYRHSFSCDFDGDDVNIRRTRQLLWMLGSPEADWSNCRL